MSKLNPNLFTQWFEKPKVSRFDRSCLKSFDMQIGKFYPAYWDMTGFGDNARGRTGHKLRLAPMIAPNFANLRFQEHTIAVPLRTILPDFQEKFNYAKNIDGASLPTISANDLFKVYKAMGLLGISPIGSLFDFLGFPVFADFYDSMVRDVNDLSKTYSSSVDGPVSPFSLQAFRVNDGNITHLSVSYRGSDWSIQDTDIKSLYSFAFSFYNKSIVEFEAFSETKEFLDDSALVSFLSDGLTVTTLMDQYLAYLFTQIMYRYFTAKYDSDSSFMEQEYSLLPMMAYQRACADWNINANITDPDSRVSLAQNYKESLLTNVNTITLNPSYFLEEPELVDAFKLFVLPHNRLYDIDFFTSLLPTSSAGDAITIPANATVLDLASLTALQKMVLKLSYSSRFRDQIWNLFNIQVSDAWLQQSTVLRSKTHFIQIGETIQTSESTTSSVLGSFSGRGFSAGSNKGYHIFCQEPCVIINFVSLVASPVYADSLHPLIKVDNILDFPLPGMDVLGNQPVRADLLSGNPGDSAYVLGYGRQYYEWLATPGTVHGRMKTSLRYWDFTRRFNDIPAFNEDFVSVNPNDDFDELFTVPDSSHAFVNIYYDCEVTRPIHRSVRIVI